ncbi:PH domain-containing protein [Streptomyces sp. NPDC006691]|uniref:PH domain-containing protein n=1 Tax=Streptomyces sp. NPDC006691 TaxID=3364757 RepID=UPI0036C1A321
MAGYVIPAVVAVRPLVCWGWWLLDPEAATARSVGLWSALAAGFALFFWWLLLRVRLEVGPEEIIAVNPGGTQRLRVEEVASVRLGTWGAEFCHVDGFKTTAYALSHSAGGRPQDLRLEQVRAALGAGPAVKPR